MKNYLIYPTKIMNITQNYSDSFSHSPHSTGSPKDYPIDENCGSTGRDYFYCPCDEVEIKRIYGVGGSGANTIWVQSTSKVLLANGEEDYVTILVTHPNDDTLKPLKKGQKFKRKEKMFLEGKDGNATGNHFHIVVSKGKFVTNGWKKNNKGAWCITGTPIKPEEAFFVDLDFTTIKKTNGLTFKTLPKIELPTPVEPNDKVDQVEVIVDRLRTRTSPKIVSDNIIGFAQKGYYNILDTFIDDKYTWYEVEQDKWVADNGSYLKNHHAKIEEPIKTENEPISETKEENNIITPSTPETNKKPIEKAEITEDNNSYYEEKEKNNPLLWLIDVIINFISKLFKTGK